MTVTTVSLAARACESETGKSAAAAGETRFAERVGFAGVFAGAATTFGLAATALWRGMVAAVGFFARAEAREATSFARETAEFCDGAVVVPEPEPLPITCIAPPKPRASRSPMSATIRI